MTEKKCNGCLIIKPLSGFQKRSKKPGDYKGRCKDCERPQKTAIMRRLRATKPEKYKNLQRDYNRQRKRWAALSKEEKAAYNKKAYARHRKRGEEYLSKRRILRKKFYHKDIESSRNRQIIDYYKRKGLPESIIEAHLSLTKVKRVIHEREKGRKTGHKKSGSGK